MIVKGVEVNRDNVCSPNYWTADKLYEIQIDLWHNVSEGKGDVKEELLLIDLAEFEIRRQEKVKQANSIAFHAEKKRLEANDSEPKPKPKMSRYHETMRRIEEK